MTVYQRIANPYQSPQASGQTGPGLLNAPTPFYAPGEIGGAYNDQSTGRAYARMILDSGATSATPVGAVAAGQLAFWKDRTQNLVTNDKRFVDNQATLGTTTQTTSAAGIVNRIAGIFMTAVSTAPGVNNVQGQPTQYVCDVCIQGLTVPVASNGSGSAGDYAVGDQTTGTARVTNAAAGTAPPTQTVGVIRGSVASNLIPVDVSLGFIG